MDISTQHMLTHTQHTTPHQDHTPTYFRMNFVNLHVNICAKLATSKRALRSWYCILITGLVKANSSKMLWKTTLYQLFLAQIHIACFYIYIHWPDFLVGCFIREMKKGPCCIHATCPNVTIRWYISESTLTRVMVMIPKSLFIYVAMVIDNSCD